MKHNQPNHPISVDSETGIYWYGQRVLRRRELIEEAMRKEAGRPAQHFPRVKPPMISGKTLPPSLDATGSFGC